MFYLRVTLSIIWALFSCTLWIFVALFSWRNPKLFSISARFLAWGGLRALGLKTTIQGQDYLKELPAIMISNHQSFLDTLILGSIWPAKVVPVGKREIGWIPIIGWWFVACGARLINRSAAQAAKGILDQQVDFIKSGEGFGIGITPEGTRNRAGKGLLPFKKGAFHLAIKAQVPIITLVVAPLGDIANWQKKTLCSAIIPIRVLPPFSTTGMNENDVDRLVQTVREAMEKTLTELETSLVKL